MEGTEALAIWILVAASLIPVAHFLYMLIVDPAEALEVFFGEGFYKL